MNPKCNDVCMMSCEYKYINTINDVYKITMINNISIQSNIKIGKGKGFNGEDIGKIQISSKKLTELIGQNVPVTVIVAIEDAEVEK